MFKMLKVQKIFFNLLVFFCFFMGVPSGVFYEVKDQICNDIISLFLKYKVK